MKLSYSWNSISTLTFLSMFHHVEQKHTMNTKNTMIEPVLDVNGHLSVGKPQESPTGYWTVGKSDFQQNWQINRGAHSHTISSLSQEAQCALCFEVLLNRSTKPSKLQTFKASMCVTKHTCPAFLKVQSAAHVNCTIIQPHSVFTYWLLKKTLRLETPPNNLLKENFIIHRFIH